MCVREKTGSLAILPDLRYLLCGMRLNPRKVKIENLIRITVKLNTAVNLLNYLCIPDQTKLNALFTYEREWCISSAELRAKRGLGHVLLHRVNALLALNKQYIDAL